MRNWITAVVIATAFLMQSCVKEFKFDADKISDKIEYTTDLAIPLVNASMTLEEILPDDEEANRYLTIDNDNFIRLGFDFDFKQISANEYFDGIYSGTLPLIEYQVDPQVVELGMDKFLEEGEFYLADPRVTISIKNYWNIPVQFRFRDFYYYESETSAGLPVTGSVFDNWVNIDPPVAPNDYAVTDILLNKDNSNLPDVISALPHHLSFGAEIETIAGGTYSVPENSVDSVTLKVELPLDLRVTDLPLQDTIEFKLGEEFDEDTTMLQSVKLSMIIENGFPLAIDAEVFFADEDYNILGSITDAAIEIGAATVDNNGKVSASATSLITITVDNDGMDDMLKAKYLIPRIVFNTTSPTDPVKFYSDYSIGIKAGARIKLKLKTE